MLSFLLSRRRWCKPGEGPVQATQYWQALPQAGFPGAGWESVQYFLRNLENLGLPSKLRRQFGELTFRFLVHCAGPSGKVKFYFAVPDIRKMGFQSVFEAVFPEVYLIPLEEHPNLELPPRKDVIVAEIVSARADSFCALPFFTVGHQAPLHEVLYAIGAGKLKDGEEVWLDLTLWPAAKGELSRVIRKAERLMNRPNLGTFSWREVWDELVADPQKSRERSKTKSLKEPDHPVLQELQTKQQTEETGIWTFFRLYVTGSQSKARMQTIAVALGAMSAPHFLRLRKISPKRMEKFHKKWTPTSGFLLTSTELAGWLQLPGCQQAVFSHMEKARSKILPAPAGLTASGIFIGKSNVPGENREIYIPVEQMLKHTFLAGMTGSGKTSTLLSMMLPMVENLVRFPNDAPGFTFLDPHGGAIRTLLSHIPESLHPKVHLVPLGVTDRPRGFNLFQADQSEQAEEITGEFVATLQQLFPGARPRAEHYLRSGLLSLLQSPPQTVLGVSRIFLSEPFRQKIIPQLDMHLRHFWLQEFSQIKNISEHLGPILNKLGALTTYPSSRRMLGQKQTFYSTRNIMDEGHIVLIDGFGCVPDLLKIISSLFFIEYHFTCRKRPQHAARPHFFLADEIHLFATSIIEKILAEDRKFGLALILATQYLSQLPGNILSAILGNVGTLLLLQLGGPDAERLAKWLKPEVTALDLMNLPELEAIVRSKGKGGIVQLFTVKNEIVRERDVSLVEKAWAFSDANDGRPVEDVEKEIEQMLGLKQERWNRVPDKPFDPPVDPPADPQDDPPVDPTVDPTSPYESEAKNL
ncbi:ATP-binding protein [Effusibacillus consociatus]|uniref:ATP-binding protein n=1 Tax=Effusibacillus consociatus TaxID=1117041 RepID=A0ABV9PZL1_9BACL